MSEEQKRKQKQKQRQNKKEAIPRRRGRPLGSFNVGLPERLVRRLSAADKVVALVRSIAERMEHAELRGHAERALAEIVAMRGILGRLPRWWRPMKRDSNR